MDLDCKTPYSCWEFRVPRGKIGTTQSGCTNHRPELLWVMLFTVWNKTFCRVSKWISCMLQGWSMCFYFVSTIVKRVNLIIRIVLHRKNMQIPYNIWVFTCKCPYVSNCCQNTPLVAKFVLQGIQVIIYCYNGYLDKFWKLTGILVNV